MSEPISAALRTLHDDLQAAVPALLRLDREALQRTAPLRFKEAPLSFHLLTLADEVAALRGAARVTLARAGFVPSEAQAIFGLGGGVRGRLLGLLSALTPAEFEAVPEGEWSPRRIAGHVVANDRRYTIQTQHSIARGRNGGTGPMRPPDSALPPSDGLAESEGTMAEVVQRVFEARLAAVAALAGTRDTDLAYETSWMLWIADVRFRLNRFGDHDREHYAHLRKTVAALGITPTDARLAIESACAAQGALAGDLIGLDPESAAASAVLPLLEQGIARQRALLAGIAGA